MTTLVTEKVDILYHAQASLEGTPVPLKRSIQDSNGVRNFFSKITDLMHRNLLSYLVRRRPCHRQRYGRECD